MTFNWRGIVYAIAGIILLLVIWGGYKVYEQNKGADNAQLQKEYNAQKDSTKVWKELYETNETARKNLHDTLTVLDSLRHRADFEANRWRDSATAAKGRLILITRPIETDSTNPSWMHRSIQLESIVADQTQELMAKNAQLQLDSTRYKLLLSQLSKDSVALYSANSNITRLDSLVDKYKSKATCKIAWLIPCLSRTQSFVVGGIGGIGATVLVNTAFKHARGT